MFRKRDDHMLPLKTNIKPHVRRQGMLLDLIPNDLEKWSSKSYMRFYFEWPWKVQYMVNHKHFLHLTLRAELV